MAGDLVYVGCGFRLVYKGTGSVCALSSYLLANHLLVFDRAQNQWFSLGSGVPGVSNGAQYFAHPVSALARGPTGLYVGGKFALAGGKGASGLSHWTLGPAPSQDKHIYLPMVRR